MIATLLSSAEASAILRKHVQLLLQREDVGSLDLDAIASLLIESATSEVRHASLPYAIWRMLEDEWSKLRHTRRHSNTTDDNLDTEVTFGRVSEPSQELRDGLLAQSAVIKGRLMNFELAHGLRLCDAVKPQLAKEASRRLSSSETLLLEGTFIRMVEELLPDAKQPVRAVLREADLERMYKRAQKAVG